MNDLKSLRKEKNMTQKELSNELGITQTYLSYLERSQRTPSLELAKKIANFFHKPLDMFK